MNRSYKGGRGTTILPYETHFLKALGLRAILEGKWREFHLEGREYMRDSWSRMADFLAMEERFVRFLGVWLGIIRVFTFFFIYNFSDCSLLPLVS